MALRLTQAQKLFAAFVVYSFTGANLFPRLADLQQQMGVAEGALGLGLIGIPVGTFLSLTFAGPLIERIGHRRMVHFGIPFLGLLLAFAVHAPGPAALFMLLLPVGMMIGAMEIVINVEADRVEAASGRHLMNRAHAFWSLGNFAAAGTGAAIAGLGISPQLHLALVVPLSVVLVWFLLADFTPAPRRPGSNEANVPRVALPTWPVLVLVMVTLPAMLLAGGSIDWSAIYLRDTFEAGPSLAALGIAAFAGVQALTRFLFDRLLVRHSAAKLARGLLVILMAGCLLVVFAQHWLLGLLGFALIGMGSSALFPMAISAAAQRTDRPAAINVAALAQTSFVTFVLGPPLLGFVAEHWGIRTAFAVGLPLILLAFPATRAFNRSR